MLQASAVVVWEWLNEHGRWRPYSPAVSRHIETVTRAHPRGGSVALGQADPRLAPYILDLQSMHQFRQDTGTIRPVRCSYYDPASAPAKGMVWEWENDNGSWTPYDMEIAITIQRAYEKQHSWIDLTPLGFCYVIDFNAMAQVNCQTQRNRRIRRRQDQVYPLVTGTLPKSQSWPTGGQTAPSQPQLPCTCPQCLLVMSVKSSTGGNSSVSTASAGQVGRRPISVARTLSASRGQAGSALTVRSPTKTLANQVNRRQAASTPALATSAMATSPRLTNGEKSRSSLGTLNRTSMQRIAMAQSRALIASGVPTVPVKNLNGTSPVHPALAGITGILMCAAGLPVCLTRPPKLVLHPPPVSKSEMKPVPGISGTCRKTSKKQTKKGEVFWDLCVPKNDKTSEEVVKKYLQKVRNPPEEDCTICMECVSSPSGYKGHHASIRPDLVGRLSRCGHVYHLHCLVAMYNNGNKDGSLQCPTCKTIYGVKTGNQPPGKMEFHVIPHSLPGYPECKSIRLVYSIPPGVQGPEHPNPGKSFTARGFPRHCYLPDNEKGRKVLRLLILAWERRLTFAVGTSSTTGESDTIIWNEVHHKTEFGSNLTGHGFPDPKYLDNVLAELSAQGITEDRIEERD